MSKNCIETGHVIWWREIVSIYFCYCPTCEKRWTMDKLPKGKYFSVLKLQCVVG